MYANLHLASLGFVVQALTRMENASQALDDGEPIRAHLEVLSAKNTLEALMPNDLLLEVIRRREQSRKSA